MLPGVGFEENQRTATPDLAGVPGASFERPLAVNISPGDVISGLALLVSIGAGFQSFSASKHAEKAV